MAPFSLFLPLYRSNAQFLFVGSGQQPEIEQWGLGGALHRLVRWAEVPKRVTEAMVARFREERLRSIPADRHDLAEEMLEGLVFPEVLPVYRRILVDADDNIWVERYRTDWEDEGYWWVFDPTGRWLGTPQVPPDIDIREVGIDCLIGVRVDENDVEEVVVLDLLR